MPPLVKTPNAQLPLVDMKTGAPSLSGGGMSLLQSFSNALNGTSVSGVSTVTLGTGTKISSGTGGPNGVVSGSPGDLYTNMAGGAGTTLFVKESGVGTTTGWVGK